MNDRVAEKIVDAYGRNPLLTGLLLLNVGMFVGFGWYITKMQHGTGVFVSELQKEIVTLAKECRGGR